MNNIIVPAFIAIILIAVGYVVFKLFKRNPN